jgi:hypothetical protein
MFLPTDQQVSFDRLLFIVRYCFLLIVLASPCLSLSTIVRYCSLVSLLSSIALATLGSAECANKKSALQLVL